MHADKGVGCFAGKGVVCCCCVCADKGVRCFWCMQTRVWCIVLCACRQGCDVFVLCVCRQGCDVLCCVCADK